MAGSLWARLYDLATTGNDGEAEALLASELATYGDLRAAAAVVAERAVCAEVARQNALLWRQQGYGHESSVCLGVAEKIEGRGK